MVIKYHSLHTLEEKALKVKLLLTDCDGVLTDGGVYYSSRGEEMKLFSLRDGMGVARLREKADVDVGIITGENSVVIAQRAAKLMIDELHLHAKDKTVVLQEILAKRRLIPEQIAYIGDDYNDLEILSKVGLSACPADALPEIVAMVDYICSCSGGHGAFREFAELIIGFKKESKIP
jgi:YrbI family 3-deoxy-D-manno-octulosonate 8-phosphate phosphatase